MKKTTTFILVTVLTAPLAFATQFDNLLFFDGIGSTVVDSDSLTSSALSNSNNLSLERQVDLFRSHYVTPATPGPKVIVAHSQGGVRALGFASKYPQDTKAVITIGSPVKGHPMLLNPQTTKNKVNKAIEIVKNGASAVIPVAGDVTLGVVDQILKAAGYGGTVVDQLTNAILMSKVTGDSANLNSILEMALDPSTQRFPGLKDLSPNSDFITSRISPKIDHTYKTVKIHTGYEWVWVKTDTKVIQLGFTRIRIPIYGFRSVPTYAFKQVLTSTTVTPKLAKSTLVSFIRGTNNDPLSFVDASTRQSIKKVMADYVQATRAAETIEAGLGVIYAGVAVSAGLSLNFPLAIAAGGTSVLFYSYSDKAGRGAEWVENYKSSLGDILGDRDNDSFIPYKAQSWDAESLGGTTMRWNNENFPDNHLTERINPQIWGVGGQLGKAVTSEGDPVLRRLLREAGLDPADGVFQSVGGMAK